MFTLLDVTDSMESQTTQTQTTCQCNLKILSTQGIFRQCYVDAGVGEFLASTYSCFGCFTASAVDGSDQRSLGGPTSEPATAMDAHMCPPNAAVLSAGPRIPAALDFGPTQRYSGLCYFRCWKLSV